MKTTILFTAGREIEYVRNKVIVNALTKYFDTTVIVDKSKNYWIRFIKLFYKLMKRKNSEDVAFIGFYGMPIMLFVNFFFKKRIIYDAFVTTHDTLCFDRKIIKPASFLGKLILYFDKISLNRASHILVDTIENKKYVCKTFHIPDNKVSSIPVSCDEELFNLEMVAEPDNTILFYSTYQPLHGTEIILRAASILQNELDIVFHIYGKGQEYLRCKKLLTELKIKNTFLLEPIPYTQLPVVISKAKICLGGPFGNTPKAKRVITGKTYQFLYLAKPVIVSDTVANRELLTPGVDAEFCEIFNPESVAESIHKLVTDRVYSKKIAANGLTTYNRYASNKIVENKYREIIIGI